MKVDVLDRLDAVGVTAWTDLHRASRLRSPFLSFIWQREWVAAFAARGRLELRTVTDADGHLVAVLPLYEAAPRVWRLTGGVDVSDYLDVLAVAGREAEAWEALLSAHGPQDVWDLHAVPAASPTVRLLPALAPAHALTATVVVEERCPVLELPASWSTYLAGLPSRHRHELLRKTRRLQREAPDARVASVSRPDEVNARFEDFLDLHRRSRVGKARFMDATMEDFFRRAILALAAEGGARVWFLDTASGPMASFVCLEWDGTVGLYNSGFDPARSALAPGLMLLARIIEDAIERGKRRFDFLRGEERYKYEFGPVPEEVYAIRLAQDGAAPA